MSQTMDNIGSRTTGGMVWLTGQTVITRIVGLVCQWALANWLLDQKDFGQIGLVYTVTTLAGQLTDPGINTVLLQKQRHFRRWVTPAFWMSLAFGLAGAIVMVMLGAGVVKLAQLRGNAAYGNPNLFWMILILAIGGPLNALGMVPMVRLQSQLRFARVAGISTGEVILQQLLVVAFAAAGWGAYSFVLPMPIVALLRTAALWIIAPVPIRARLGIHRWPALIASTGWVFGQRILTTATAVGDYFTLGWVFGSDVLVGQYYFAFNLSVQVVRVLCDNATAVLLPAMSAIHLDRARTLIAAQRASRSLASMVIPIASLQILLAGPGIRLIYKSIWEPSIILVQLLSFGPLLLSPAWPYGVMVTASGRFRDSFFCWVFNGLTFFALVIPFSLMWGPIGTSIAVSLWSWLSAMAFGWTAANSFVGVWKMLSAAAGSLAAAAVATAPSAVIVLLMPHSRWINLITIAVVTPLFASIYVLLLRKLDKEAIETFLTHLGRIMRPNRWPFSRPIAIVTRV